MVFIPRTKIWDGLVFLQVDTHDDSFLVALSVETGEPVWKTERAETPSWSTPTVVTTSNSAELVVNGSNFVRRYDPRTGQERWRVATGSPIATPSPVDAGELSIVASGGLGSSRPIVAVRHGAAGDLTPDLKAGESRARSGLAWSVTGRGPFTPTPLAYRGVLYVLANNGVLDAYDADTGTELFRARVPGFDSGFSASPVAADGRIYLVNEDGACIVVEAARAFRHITTNDIGEPVMATRALSRGVIVLDIVAEVSRKPQVTEKVHHAAVNEHRRWESEVQGSPSLAGAATVHARCRRLWERRARHRVPYQSPAGPSPRVSERLVRRGILKQHQRDVQLDRQVSDVSRPDACCRLGPARSWAPASPVPVSDLIVFTVCPFVRQERYRRSAG